MGIRVILYKYDGLGTNYIIHIAWTDARESSDIIATLFWPILQLGAHVYTLNDVTN